MWHYVFGQNCKLVVQFFLLKKIFTQIFIQSTNLLNYNDQSKINYYFYNNVFSVLLHIIWCVTLVNTRKINKLLITILKVYDDEKEEEHITYFENA